MTLTPLYRLAYFESVALGDEAISAIWEAMLLLPTGMALGMAVDIIIEGCCW